MLHPDDYPSPSAVAIGYGLCLLLTFIVMGFFTFGGTWVAIPLAWKWWWQWANTSGREIRHETEWQQNRHRLNNSDSKLLSLNIGPDYEPTVTPQPEKRSFRTHSSR